MRQHTLRTPVVILAVTILAGLVPVLPAAGATGRPVARVQPGTEPTDPPYRVGFVSTSGPRLLRADLEDSITRPPVDGLAQDAAALFGELAWIGFPVAGGLADPDGELFWRGSSTPEVRQLTDDEFIDRNPVLSPDRDRIAFESDRAGNVDIWTISIDGTDLRQVTTDPAPDTGPTWSPDGVDIVYAGFGEDPAGDLYQIAAAGGGEPQRLTDSPGADIQPAWNPADEDQITFTTTRFQELGDVVRMPVAGGPVERVVPEPWDSSEPSWSPNGQRLAFVTRRDDPQGDVYLLEDGVVTPLATRPGTAETGPSQEGFGVYYTELGEGDGTFDVWSADRDGGDRLDLTGRPGSDETGPAWSADGTRLAYSEAQPDGGARIVVTDAGGLGRQLVAPPGTLDSDIDLDPSWSPDGTRLAFTRRQLDPIGLVASSTILVVRVADGIELGRLPVPPGMSALDGKPAWSPDGARLAFERSSQARRPPFVAEPPADRPVNPSDTFTVEMTVPVPAVPAQPDVVFLVDATASMEEVIDSVRAELVAILGDIRREQPAARFALAFYRDLADPTPFRVLQPLTTDIAAVATARSGLVADGGGDTPEDWISALHEVATGAVEFLPGRVPVVVLIGDAASHEPSGGHQLTEPPLDPAGADGDTLTALREAGVRVVAVDAQQPGGEGGGDGLDGEEQASTVTSRTGGALVTLAEASGTVVRQTIVDAIGDIPVPVVPEIESCDPGLSVSVAPDRRDLVGGGTGEFTATVQVAGDAPAGARLRCVVAFQLGDGSRASHEIAVRVGDGVSPQVRVDDLVVAAEDRSGAVVTYAASAVSAGGIPLTPACAPASGTRFPIGLTVVTCTATDLAGNTGTDTALVTVVDEANLGRFSRVWVATLVDAGPDVLAFGDQVDLASRVDESCTGGLDLLAPAWSPAGDELAYALVGEGSLLCAVDPDGGEARQFGPPSFARIDDPAWSPDGERIAFGLSSFSDPTVADIWAVPAAGGEPTLLVGGEGQQRQPAFQPPPRPDPPDPPDPDDPTSAAGALTVTVAVAPVPGFVGGDDLTVSFTVRNRSGVSLLAATLSPRLPGSLPVAAGDPRCASPSRCPLGTLLAGAAVTRTFRLRPAEAVRAVVSAQASATPPAGPALSARGAALAVVVAPELIVSPPLGPPGSVPAATGVNFPPGATVRLVWRVEGAPDGTPPITGAGNELVVAPDGALGWPALVFRKDTLGPRQLVAVPVDGPGFGEVSAEFLVVPRSLDPPEFEGRG